MEKHNESSKMSCQNIKQGTCDYISCLSDDLLRHILSFLTMKLVIKTSILSKRWRYLWTTVPCLVFSDSWNLVGVDPVTFIDKSIARHVGTTLRKFHIMFEYKDTDGPQIDSWIQFAVKCNVEEMVLVLDGCSSDDFWENDPKYELPHYLFQCETIKDLSISGTQFNLPTSVHLRSLRKLSLYNLDIPSDAIEHLTSSCPHLEHLSLFGCNMSDDLNIYDPNGRLQILRIHELQSTYSDTTNVVIHAPNLHFLQFEWCLPRGSYLVKKLSSFTNVSFLFGSRENYNDRLYDATDGYHMALILHGLHVKNLELSCFCVQVLSLWEFERKEHFCIDATSIQLETRFSKWELPGIAYVLMNSSNLETLKINFRGVKRFWELLQIKIDDAITQQYDFEETGYWKSHELVFSTLPCKIKRVTIYGFPHHSSNVNKYNAIWMVRFLLKNLKMLEKITIFIANKRGSEVLDGDHSELRDLFTCGFSAACPNAELLIF